MGSPAGSAMHTHGGDVPPAHDESTHGGHAHSQTRTRDALRLGFFLTVIILAVEAIAGYFSHSLALLSDAGHVLTDAAALGMAWFAAVQAERPANSRRTFGYHRVGILTALGNGLTLVVIALAIAIEGIRRLMAPQQVEPALMIAAASVAIIVNLFIGTRLHNHAGENLNSRAAVLHVFGDVGASTGVVVGAVAIALTGAYWVDPVISFAIAALIAVGAVRLIGETISILLESTPAGVSLPDLVRDMMRVPGVRDVHDLHVWTITSGMRALSCHALIDDLPPSDSASILDGISAMLCQKYNISHTTVQFESEAHSGHEGYCACPPGTESRLYCDLRTHTEQQHEHAGHSH